MEKSRIRLLADSLVDQIAAGEVVERPASVVKELVENSLDAGAQRIQIEVREGGAAWIAVTDDGGGMTPAEARMALQRHATSKLSSAADLNRIASFGFRGEALPAIASVSRLRLVTRPAELSEAWEIRIAGGELENERAVGAPAGTRIEVADLFASVPARRKFLKRPATEWGHIADWLTRLALSLHDVDLELRRDDRKPTVWPGCANRLDRVASVLSEEEASALVAAEGESEAGHLHALVSVPDRTRPNANGIYLFVNGRPIRDASLRHALLHVYRDLLPRGRFPSAFLFLTVPPESVDVNVHPAKWEVRFADPQALHQLVRRTVRSAIEGRSWLGGGGPPAAAGDLAAGRSQAADARIAPGAPVARIEGGGSRVADRSDSLSEWIFARREAPADELAAREGSGAVGGAERPRQPESRRHFGGLRLLGQLLASYLLVESSDGLLLVDQHAAHERVLYERLRAQWLAHGVESQGLLIPSQLELGAAGLATLVESTERLRRFGFEVEAFGETTAVIRSVPALLEGRDPSTLVSELVQELAEAGGALDSEAPEDARVLQAADRIFASLACHSARRAGDHLEPAEQRGLLEELDTIPWAPTCPHGRPVAIALDRGEIEQRFRRR